jgi:outer membrane protein assembly factor BamE (lipoprotein component of BamABCDE complex)
MAVGSYRGVAALALIAALAACSPQIEPHGDLPQPDRLSQIDVGRTKSDVIALLGTPSTTFNMDGERWYYISNQTQEYTWHKVEEVERLVIVIEFDKTDKITSVKKLNLADGKDVAMVDRTTPTSGQGLSLFGQLIGNVGRFEGETK